MKNIYAIVAYEGVYRGLHGVQLCEVIECEDTDIDDIAADMSREVMDTWGTLDKTLKEEGLNWSDNEDECYEVENDLIDYEYIELNRALLPLDKDGDIDFATLNDKLYNEGLQEIFYKYGIQEVD